MSSGMKGETPGSACSGRAPLAAVETASGPRGSARGSVCACPKLMLLCESHACMPGGGGAVGACTADSTSPPEARVMSLVATTTCRSSGSAAAAPSIETRTPRRLCSSRLFREANDAMRREALRPRVARSEGALCIITMSGEGDAPEDGDAVPPPSSLAPPPRRAWELCRLIRRRRVFVPLAVIARQRSAGS